MGFILITHLNWDQSHFMCPRAAGDYNLDRTGEPNLSALAGFSPSSIIPAKDEVIPAVSSVYLLGLSTSNSLRGQDKLYPHGLTY